MNMIAKDNYGLLQLMIENIMFLICIDQQNEVANKRMLLKEDIDHQIMQLQMVCIKKCSAKNLTLKFSLILFIGHHEHHSSGSHGRYWIPRIQLYFLAEDPRVFADRVAKAYHDRKRTEAELRSALFIDCMPIDGIGKLDDERVKRMIELAKTSALSKIMYVV